MKRYLAIFLVAFIAAFPAVTFAAWVATDNFETYTVGNIAGQSGGTGFSSAWTLGSGTSGNYTIVSSPAVDTRAASIVASAGFVDHTLSSTQTTGSVYFLVQRSSVSASNGARIRMPAAAGAVEYDVGFYGPDMILFANSGFKTIESGLSANTWYEVQVEYDTTIPQHRARVRPRYGTWGSWTALWEPNGGSITGAITSFGLQSLGTDASVTYFDRISDTEEPITHYPLFIRINNGGIRINNGRFIMK